LNGVNLGRELLKYTGDFFMPFTICFTLARA
jgi:hypothetical protein